MGPCAKKVVRATLVEPMGRRWVAENEVRNPQSVCPRLTDNVRDDYFLCQAICQQPYHAEVAVLRQAGMWAVGSTIYVEHKRVCAGCQKSIKLAGADWKLGPPPD